MTPRVIYRPTGAIHLVVASGSPEDGSLTGFRTYCGREVGQPDQWIETTANRPVCIRCQQGAGPIWILEERTTAQDAGASVARGGG